MFGVILGVLCAHLGLAAIDLPRLWRRREERRSFWAAALLFLFSSGLAVPVLSGYAPPSVFRGIRAVLGPVSTLLFKERGLTE